MTGVYTVKDLVFKIDIGSPGSPNFVTIKDVETMKVSLKGTVEKWTPMDQGGFARNLMTAKEFSIEHSGKRNIGDPGNDFIFGTMLQVGTACNSTETITFPNGDILSFPCVIDLTGAFGGDSTKVTALDWSAHADGKPTYIPFVTPTAITLASVPLNNATAVAVSVNPVLTFNNALVDYSATLIKSSDNSIVPSTATIDASNKVVTIRPTSALTAATIYLLVVSSVKDVYGQSQAPQVIKFTTA